MRAAPGFQLRRAATLHAGLRQAGVRVLALTLALGALCGCAELGVKPWVKPYERNQLADPIMSWNRDPVSNTYMEHVRGAREGARGAEGGAGGGCGCN